MEEIVLQNKKNGMRTLLIVLLVELLSLVGTIYGAVLMEQAETAPHIAFFAVSIIFDFVSDSRKVKEYSSKDDAWSKVKKYGIISNNLWFLFGVVLLLVVLILRSIIG